MNINHSNEIVRTEAHTKFLEYVKEYCQKQREENPDYVKYHKEKSREWMKMKYQTDPEYRRKKLEKLAKYRATKKANQIANATTKTQTLVKVM